MMTLSISENELQSWTIFELMLLMVDNYCFNTLPKIAEVHSPCTGEKETDILLSSFAYRNSLSAGVWFSTYNCIMFLVIPFWHKNISIEQVHVLYNVHTDVICLCLVCSDLSIQELDVWLCESLQNTWLYICRSCWWPFSEGYLQSCS